MNSNIKKIFLFAVFVFFSFALYPQKPIIYDSPAYEYNLAIELFEKEKYGSAQQYFRQVYENENSAEEVKINSYFYMGVCAIYLNNNDADFLLRSFVRHYPVHANVVQAYLHLGKFYYDQKKYKQSLEYFNKIQERYVPKEELAEYQFKKGYAYFVTKKYDEAKPLFNEVRKTENPYQHKAIYYLAHIAYDNEHYEAALEDFLLLKEDKDFERMVPFYLSQIYFHQQRYNEVINVAVPLLPKADNQTEMNRIIALSYYNLGEYKNALKYFETYIASRKANPDRNDNFAMGYCYYQQKNYQKAIQYLSHTTREKDAIAQNSFYLIGDAYRQTNELNLATQSFLEASKLDFSSDIKEDALYNYAKLQYETSSSPFNTAIKALQQYIDDYPNSARAEEAISYLSKIYLTTKNYQEAIISLEKLQSKSPTLLRAYQRCTHYRALELINNKYYKEALKLLEKSTIYPMNMVTHASNLYWIAEAKYRLEDYQDAYYAFQSYYKNQHAPKDPNYPISYYSYGYAALKTKKYKEAQQAFNTLLTQHASVISEDINADATARLADSYFMQKNLKKAIEFYEKCEKQKHRNYDYAIYQQSKCYGFQGKEKKKIEALEKLIQLCPNSSYCDDAEFDLAGVYHTRNDYDASIKAHKKFIGKYPKSPFIRQAYNKLAQAYLNTQDIEASILTFKYVFENYPGSSEAKDALANLEYIYTELGTTGEFFEYIKNKGNINISVEKQDSTAYKSAENKYLRGNCEAAIKGFESYLQAFPNGLFAAKAHFYKGECLYGMNNFDEALKDYEALINKYNTRDNETALRKAAIILFNKQIFDKALTYFNSLSDISSSENTTLIAYTGIMRSSYELKKYDVAHKSAEVILYQLKADEELKNEALYIAGKTAYEMKEFHIARQNLAILAKKSDNDLAAEAAYLTALIAFDANQLQECDKIINEILVSNYSSEYWYAKTFILYGDLYAAKGNLFQAKHTYQSIIDNYTGEDLKVIAQEKIDAIVAQEEADEQEENDHNEGEFQEE